MKTGNRALFWYQICQVCDRERSRIWTKKKRMLNPQYFNLKWL